MKFEPDFPTPLHQDAAGLVRDYFLQISAVDTVLVVNSCARGKAVPESDLDFAILVKQGVLPAVIKIIEADWQTYALANPTILKYKKSGPFAHLHLDVIDGQYAPLPIENGEPIDYFEIEIGNQICYSAPIGKPGFYFQELKNKWLPYYNEDLRLQRLTMTGNACRYELKHIPFFINRSLYFQAFDTLCKAFQLYLQALFMANKTYPIAYNKWIKEQVVKWLNRPDLYPKLPPILCVSNLESNEMLSKAKILDELLTSLAID